MFLRARRHGVGSLPLEPLTLTSNFRSDPSLVKWVNETFASIFPKEEDLERGAIPYSPFLAIRSMSEDAGLRVHAFLEDDQASEAERILSLIPEADSSTAVLVRARSHLTEVVALLRKRNIPFQAIEIDQLGERPVIQDLMALTFALLHLADRISWLAILRAPWCGLTIHDLHAISAADTRSTIWDLLRSQNLELTMDGRARLERCLPALTSGVWNRGRIPLRTLIEQTWLALGGPAGVAEDVELADAAAYFDLLDGIDEAGDLASFEALREQVAELFAPPMRRPAIACKS